MPQHIARRIHQDFTNHWKLVASGIGSGLGVGWLADAINDGPLFKALLWKHCVWEAACIGMPWAQHLIGILFALALSVACAFALATQIGRGKVVQLQEQTLRPHKVLIMWLSTGNERMHATANGAQQVSWASDGQTVGPFTLTNDPDSDARHSNTSRWNMWQHLRAVAPHARALQALHILVTTDTESRHGFAKAMFQHYLGLSDAVIQAPTRINEHNIQSQIDTVNRLVKEVKARIPGLQDSDIMVDCTGGLKLSSIAAACATLNNPIELQYVNTDATDLSVKSYQLVYLAPQN